MTSSPQLPFVVVLAVVVTGLGVVAASEFRAGCVIVALGLLLAATFRLALPVRRAGLLVVRSRALDVVTLAGLGLTVATLALVVPHGA